jgi:hypothetical protein
MLDWKSSKTLLNNERWRGMNKWLKKKKRVMKMITSINKSKGIVEVFISWV